jgi:hypothetical protein
VGRVGRARSGVRAILLIATVVGGCGGSSGPRGTRAAQCAQIAQTFCNRAARSCQLFPIDQMGDCTQAGVTSCCSGTCAETAVSSPDDFATCIDDIVAATCGMLDLPHGGSLPASCVRVARATPAQ